jgi:hypothetical protein
VDWLLPVIDVKFLVQDMNVKKEGEIQILTRRCEQTRDIVETRTFSQFQAVIEDAAPVNPYENTLLVRSLS